MESKKINIRDKAIIVKQFLSGEWVELIRMPSEDDWLTEEQLEESLTKIKDLIFDHDKVNVTLPDQVVIFNRLDGPIRIEVDDDNRGVAKR